MDRCVHDNNSSIVLDMMKHHISNGLPFEYTTNCKKFD